MARDPATAPPTVASPGYDARDPVTTTSATAVGGPKRPTNGDCEWQEPRGAANLAEGGSAPAIPVDESYGRAHAHLPSPSTASEALDGPDIDLFDADSAFEGSSSLTSLASAVTRYRIENGRLYHSYKDGAYWAPNDEAHNEQQDLAHHLWLLTLDNRLHLAPLPEDIQKILDVGTGTGIWAIDMADNYPSAHVIGVDLSPTQPSWLPPNCSFEVDDICLPWTYSPDSFDYIHIREMFGSVDSWPTLFVQCFTALRSGGWCENVEHSVWPVSDDGSVGPDHVFTRYGRIMEELAGKRGKEFDCWKKNRKRMEDAGFVEVQELRMKWPMRGWSSDPKMRTLGFWNQARIQQGIEGFAIRMLTTVGGWSYTEVQAFVGEIRTALRDRSIHAYLDISVIYGQKP